MLTLWFYARYAERASLRRYLPVVAAFALGLMSKPTLVTLPFLLLLLDYWPLERVDGGSLAAPSTSYLRLVVEKIPLFVLAAASCIVTLVAQRGAMQLMEQTSISGRVANATVAYIAYIWKMLCPADLAVFYPLPKGPPPAWEVAAAVAVLLTVSASVFLARMNAPACSSAGFGTLGPWCR